MAPALDEPTAARFARLALACVTREYPNKITDEHYEGVHWLATFAVYLLTA